MPITHTIQASEDDKDKTLLKYYAKQYFLFLPTPNRGTGDTRQETMMLRDHIILQNNFSDPFKNLSRIPIITTKHYFEIFLDL